MSQLQVTLTTGCLIAATGPVMNDLLGKQVDMTCDQAHQHDRARILKQAGEGLRHHHENRALPSAGPSLPTARRRPVLKRLSSSRFLATGVFRARGGTPPRGSWKSGFHGADRPR